MFLEIKFKNLFFLIFIIVLLLVTPLYFVKANKANIIEIPKKNPFSCKINSKLTNDKSFNELLLPAKLELKFLKLLDNIEETKRERNYLYELIFQDNNLSKKLVKEKKQLKDLLLFCLLNTSILDSNDNDLTDLFDIKCYFKREEDNVWDPLEKIFYEINEKGSKKQKINSFFEIDLKEWKYYIKIEIKTKLENYKKYKNLENKKIKLKCELDITDENNYPFYLSNLFNEFQNKSRFFPNMSITNYDFDFISDEISPNTIWLVNKDDYGFYIYDYIIRKEVQYKNKTYQDLMNLYRLSYNKKFKNDDVSRIKLYFFKEKYDINLPYTHSSLHFKKDWDIGEIKYYSDSTKGDHDAIIMNRKKELYIQNSKQIINTKEISEMGKKLENIKTNYKEKNFEGYSRGENELNKKNLDIVKKEREEYERTHYTSIGTKDMKTYEKVKATEKNYMDYKENIKITRTMPNSNSNSSLQKSINKEENLNPISSG